MARRSKPLPVRALRRALIVFLTLFVVGVSLLYWFGQERSGRVQQEDAQKRTPAKERDALVTGKGFDYTVSIGDTRLFRIKAKRYRSDDEKSYDFEDVEIEWDRDDGSSYILEADSGTFDQEATEATVAGNVLFRSSSGLILRSEGLSLVSHGRMILSSAPVSFELDERYSGRADQLRLRVKKSILYLTGNVVVESRQPEQEPAGTEVADAPPLESETGGATQPQVVDKDMRLTCQSLSYEENENMIRADGSVVLTQGASGLSGRRLSLLLDEKDRSIVFLQARWGIRGTFVRSAQEQVPQIIDFSSEYMSTQFDKVTEEPSKIELEGTLEQPAQFEVEEQGKPTRRLVSTLLQVDFEHGRVQRAQSLAAVEMIEYQDPETPLRQTRGDSADALFDSQGRLSKLTMMGAVTYQDEDVVAQGDRAEIDQASNTLLLIGDPARVESERGTIEAPRILRDQKAGSVLAEEPVRATLNPSSDGGLAGSALGGAESPVQMQATRARWLDAENRFFFTGTVRAWQGESLLIAEEVEGRTDAETLKARGAVKTLWKPRPSSEQDRGPIEVTADEMEYSRKTGRLVYQGSSRIHQDGKIVLCDHVEVFLDAADELESATCEGHTVIRDPAAGRTIRGDSAVYQIASGTIEVLGSPVSLKEGNNSAIEGPRLMYFLDEDRAQVLGERVPIGVEAEEIEAQRKKAEAEERRRLKELEAAAESGDGVDSEAGSDVGEEGLR